MLLRKELRDLAASRAWWLLLLFIGPLVGHAFITAVESYAEASGTGGGFSALAQGLSPLDGLLVPALGAYDLAVTLLFPFVAIRVIAAEKESGAWKLMLQLPSSIGTVLAAKALALLIGWMVAWIPGAIAIFLWKLYGGHLYAPELLNLIIGHVLRAVLASGIAVAAATLTTSSGTAAIVTLAFTVGTWALDFVAAGRGGLLQTFAAYTPGAALRTFEQGTLHLDVVLVFIILGWAGFALAAVLLATGRPIASRLRSTAAWVVTVGVLLLAGSNVRASWDLSENRRNSFPQSAEQALKQIHTPLKVTVFLAAEDPRLMDLDRNILAKLRRIVPKVDVTYAAQSRTGLFEGAADHYGEVWYAFADRKIMSRSTTEPIVLEAILQLAGISQPPAGDDPPHLGYPLNARPTGAAWIFYLIWPLAVAALGWLHFRG